MNAKTLLQNVFAVGLKNLRVGFETWVKIVDKGNRLIKKHTDRYGFLYAETFAISGMIVWTLIQWWVRWPAVEMHIAINGHLLEPTVFAITMFLLPVAEWGFNVAGGLLFGALTVAKLRAWASQHAILDINKDRIEDIFEEIAAKREKLSEEETTGDNVPQLTPADLVYLHEIITRASQTDSISEEIEAN